MREKRIEARRKAARDGALLGFFIGGTIAVLSLACFAMAQLEEPQAVGWMWAVWAFLLYNFWFANSPYYPAYKAWRAKRAEKKAAKKYTPGVSVK